MIAGHTAVATAMCPEEAAPPRVGAPLLNRGPAPLSYAALGCTALFSRAA